MFSLIANAQEQFGFADPNAPVLRVRYCAATQPSVTVTPACLPRAIAYLEDAFRRVDLSAYGDEAKIEAVFDPAKEASPVFLADGKPMVGPIVVSIGPVICRMMDLLALTLRNLPYMDEFEEAVVICSSASLRNAVLTGNAAPLRPGARGVIAVCLSCHRSLTTDGADPNLELPMLAACTCDSEFAPFVAQAYEAAGKTVLRRVEGGQMRRLRADLTPILEALDAYPVDMIGDDREGTVADEPILAANAPDLREEEPTLIVISY